MSRPATYPLLAAVLLTLGACREAVPLAPTAPEAPVARRGPKPPAPAPGDTAYTGLPVGPFPVDSLYGDP